MLNPMPHRLSWVGRFALVLIACTASPATAGEPITFRVSFPEPETHYAHVEATVPTDGQDHVELMMPVWTPGSYLVREYSRHLESLSVRGTKGGELPVAKVRKNRWRVECAGESTIVVEYRLYCRELSVRTNWVEAGFAFLNGAATFVTTPSTQREHRVHWELPPAWRVSATALARVDAEPNTYLAPDFDLLVDSPVVLGNPTIVEFEVAGKPHRFVNLGGVELWDLKKAAEDVKKIVEVQHEFWRVVPYERYDFLNLILESGGGLEHANSCLMLTSRWSFRDPERYRSWLGLVSHEFFHTWNVKRLRPIELGPFDYEGENHSLCLWIVEGLTSYYDDLLLARAELLSEKQYLELLGKNIESLQDTPGRLVHPLEATSYDAWIKYYRSDENSVNSTISYYTKGAVVGFLLDARIREATDNTRSLDDVMRRAYELYSGDRGYTAESFRSLTERVAGVDLTDWFGIALESTEELSYDSALTWFGLRFKPVKDPAKGEETATGIDSPGADEASDSGEVADGDSKTPPPWIGLETRSSDGRLIVQRVRRGTPAHRAGVNVDDEIVGIDGYRISDWSAIRKQFREGDRATLLVARRGRLQELEVVFAAQPPKRWQLEADPDAPPAAAARRFALARSTLNERSAAAGAAERS